MNEPFSNISLISDEYEYSNIRIKLPKILFLFVFVLFPAKNLFRYLYGKYVASEYIWIFVWYICCGTKCSDILRIASSDYRSNCETRSIENTAKMLLIVFFLKG